MRWAPNVHSGNYLILAGSIFLPFNFLQLKHETDQDLIQLLAGDRYGIVDPHKLHEDNFSDVKMASSVMDKPYMFLQVGLYAGRLAKKDGEGNTMKVNGKVQFQGTSVLRSVIRVINFPFLIS